ncbi:MAG: glycogen debranching N-terminal domain-containing protein [Jatrophihabitantaceae bacterium]
MLSELDDDEASGGERLRQPYLHELITAVRAPAVALSGRDGQIRSGVHGVFRADRRLLSVLIVRVDGTEPEPVASAVVDADHVRFVAVLRELGDPGADPTVTLERSRRLDADRVVESITVLSRARESVAAVLEVEAASDLAAMDAVKSGLAAPAVPVVDDPSGLSWSGPDGTHVRLTASPGAHSVDGGQLRWPVSLAPGERFELTLSLTLADGTRPAVLAAEPVLRRSDVAVRSGDHRLNALVERSLADLDALTAADPLAPGDRFLTAGAPWFLTLFGRDSIWAARMLLPLGTDLAAGTLRALARRQGTSVDPASAQQPGKIMHEMRADSTAHKDANGALRLPALYYGTVDATPLWVSLLHDAWRWGLPPAEVDALLPTAHRAMDWLARFGTAANGFVSYRDDSRTGLANQGWKDSGDSVQFGDGRLAEPPIALCEVQGYAHAAAVQAADLFDAFGLPGGDRWRAWAAGLAQRFRRSFWVSDPDGDYPAIALDVHGKTVDTVTSNIGHLLGTGLLNADEERLVVARLGAPDMDCGFGLRTMSSRSTGFNPLAYHGGSVWVHDTAITIAGLTRVDDPAAVEVAGSLVGGLLAASPAFDYRLPELLGGYGRSQSSGPVPYPAACRPQAWAAAASIGILSALLGLSADVPGGTLGVAPPRPNPVGALDVRGLRIGGQPFGVGVGPDGSVQVSPQPQGIGVTLG